jgi:predicted enzyme related to lactoylglutathione lyase
MSPTRTYPNGVPSWIDTEQPDLDAASDFYHRLFGWEFTTVSSEGAPFYAIASLDGRDVAGLGSAQGAQAGWNTYIAVDDADTAAARATALGGAILAEPFDVGQAGRLAICADPSEAVFRLWQARQRPGAQIVNERGSWNFSDLHTDQPDTISFYTELFGWSVEDLGFATLVRRPGYGDHLEATVDPDIRARQQSVTAPAGFEDAIAWVAPLESGTSPHWHVTFAVTDRDAIAAAADHLGAEVITTEDTPWTRTVLARDPQGAIFTASQFTPPE